MEGSSSQVLHLANGFYELQLMDHDLPIALNTLPDGKRHILVGALLSPWLKNSTFQTSFFFFFLPQIRKHFLALCS